MLNVIHIAIEHSKNEYFPVFFTHQGANMEKTRGLPYFYSIINFNELSYSCYISMILNTPQNN